MTLALIVLGVALAISGVAAFYSIVGLMAIFSASLQVHSRNQEYGCTELALHAVPAVLKLQDELQCIQFSPREVLNPWNVN